MQYSRKRSSRWRQTCQDWAHTNGVARDWLSRVVPDALLVSTCKHVRFGRLSLSCVVILSDAAWQKIIAADFYRIEEGPAQASGALVLAPVVLRGSTRSVASLEAVLGATGRSRQRSCFAVDERLLLPQHNLPLIISTSVLARSGAGLSPATSPLTSRRLPSSTRYL